MQQEENNNTNPRKVTEVSHLSDFVFLWFVDLACQTAVCDSIVDNKLVGFEAWLFIQFWPWGKKIYIYINVLVYVIPCYTIPSMITEEPKIRKKYDTVPVYSGMDAGEERVDAFSQSLSPFCVALRPGDISLDGEWERLQTRKWKLFRLITVHSTLCYLKSCSRPGQRQTSW